jgi:beta-mannosidase
MQQRLDPDTAQVTTTRTENGYRVVVTARSYVRDAFLAVDRVDARASADNGLVTLLAGESITFHVTSDADVDPAEFAHELVLRSANQLVGGDVRE